MTRPFLSRYSVRLRITSVVALLTSIALIGVGFTLYMVQRQNLDRSIDREQAKEIAEFRTLQETGTDPDTGEPFSDANRLLESFLERNFPGPGEILYGFPTTGQPLLQGTGDEKLENSSVFVKTVDTMRREGGSAEIDIGSGRYRLAAQPINDANGDAAFVVVHNLTTANVEVNKLLGTYAMVATLSWLIITCMASLMAGRLLTPVRRLSETAHAVWGGDLSSRIEVTGNDDLTELQRTFNEMLDRVESAFVTQRQLLDDAGHELRTPLTILRGHLELLDARNRTDTESTRALLLDETDRMSRLVDDLLMLAKVRRPDFVKFGEEDLEALTAECFHKARALGNRKWTFDGAASRTAQLDGQRLTQAMMQLVENAVRYTAETDEIGIGSRSAGPYVEFWVRDSGSGVAEADRDLIFTRFHRGSNGTQRDEGFGLGLSIVAAIATAHGGHAQLDEATDGATFRLVLPRRQPSGSVTE